MKPEDLKSLLKQADLIPERNACCPTDTEIASYLEGGLSGPRHKALELHLADCDFCLDRVGLLGRVRDADTTLSVPDLLLARARKLVRQDNPGRQIRVYGNWAAAAAVVAALGLLVQMYAPASVDQAATPAGNPVRQERSIDTYATVPELATPQEFATINPLKQPFTWSPVRDSLYYQIRIVSDVGDLVWQERVEGTRWEVPEHLILSSDSEYFVRVDAYLTETKSVNSDYVAFKVDRDK